MLFILILKNTIKWNLTKDPEIYLKKYIQVLKYKKNLTNKSKNTKNDRQNSDHDLFIYLFYYIIFNIYFSAFDEYI